MGLHQWVDCKNPVWLHNSVIQFWICARPQQLDFCPLVCLCQNNWKQGGTAFISAFCIATHFQPIANACKQCCHVTPCWLFRPILQATTVCGCPTCCIDNPKQIPQEKQFVSNHSKVMQVDSIDHHIISWYCLFLIAECWYYFDIAFLVRALAMWSWRITPFVPTAIISLPFFVFSPILVMCI